MENSQTIVQPPKQPILRFKTTTKSEQITEYYRYLVKLRTRRPRLVHHMEMNYENVSDGCENLHTPLEKLRHINSLYISFYEVDFENSIIFMKLKSLYFLQEFSLKLSDSSYVSLKGIRNLANGLARMKLLKKLALNFEACDWFNDKRLHFIFRGLKKNRNLQSLELILGDCYNITGKNFKDLASILKHSSRSLKELCLNLTDLDFTEGYPLDFMAEGLTFLKGLQKLTINFSNLKIPEGRFYYFTFTLRYLKSLEILNLDFSSLSISPFEFTDLVNSFTSLTELHTLSLSFRRNNTFDGYDMKVLSQCLEEIAYSLKNLTLDFRESKEVHDYALTVLASGLKTLDSLSEITLHCDNCRSIGSNGVFRVIHALTNLPDLHTVTLGFSGCRPIEDDYYLRLKRCKNIINLTFNYEKDLLPLRTFSTGKK